MCCMVEVSFTTGLPMCFAHLVDKVLVGGEARLLGPFLAGMGGAVAVAAGFIPSTPEIAPHLYEILACEENARGGLGKPDFGEYPHG